jgi:hypothetical protein
MKIAILTLPFNGNYGGVLQAYALQAVLKKMGHQVWTINRVGLYSCIKYFFYALAQGEFIRVAVATFQPVTHRFIKCNIRLTKPIQRRIKKIFPQYEFEAYIVGSDQVWRLGYAPFLSNYFLDFTKEEKVKRIAYAASFGVDQWEFTPEQTDYCAALLKKFDAVSVRESSGIRLCKEYLGVKAKQVLDPTLLLTEDDYLSLTRKKSPKKHKKVIVAYVLDINTDKRKIMSDMSLELQCKGKLITIRPCHQEKNWTLYENNYYLSVEDWLHQIQEASFVITDSFHGCVFAILFNKPFVAIENKGRGSSRFHSLLNLLVLQDRLVSSHDDFLCKKAELVGNPINWDRVNSILEIKRNESKLFLMNALSGK